MIYQSDEITRLEVIVENETVWLTQEQIAVLFGVKRPAITKHIKNIYACGELDESSTCSILEHMGNSGVQHYNIRYFNLDLILSVGYRVNSKNAVSFRKWASRILKEYLLGGVVIKQQFIALEDRIDRRLHMFDKRLEQQDERIDFLVQSTLLPREGVFYSGQIFDAYVFVSDLIKSAQSKIILIDNYIDESVLLMLSKREAGVLAQIRTGKLSETLQLDIQKHNSQYSPINVIQVQNIHDRFLIIDNGIYHIGASLKDLGKKLFAFSKLNLNIEQLL